MSKPLTIATEPPKGGGRDVQYWSQGFRPPRDCAGATFMEYTFAPTSQQRAISHMLSDSGRLVQASFIESVVPSAVPEHISGEMFLSEAEAFIRQMQEDLDELPASVRSSHPAELCRRFVEGVGTALAYVPQARCAVFGDEEDGVELVAHSRASMRQVSFEFGPGENSINIISIDEEMRRFERACGLEKVLTLAEAIAWLNPR